MLRDDGLTAVAADMAWLLSRGGWLQKVVAFKAYKANVTVKRLVVTPTQMFFGLITLMRLQVVPYEWW